MALSKITEKSRMAAFAWSKAEQWARRAEQLEESGAEQLEEER